METNKFTFVTYLSNDRDYKGALLLNYNLKKLNHKFNLTCIVLEGVSDKIRNILKKSRILLHEFNLRNILNQFNMSEKYCDYLINKHYYGKFLIFNLTQYDKIIYLDTDLLIRENIDNLFSYDTNTNIYMTYDIRRNGDDLHFRQTDFNSGVIIFKPSLDIYNKCYLELANFENNINNLITDQTILNQLNQKTSIHVSYLELKYNYIAMLGEIYKTIKQDKPIIIHFTLFPKLWDMIDFNENIIEYYMYSDSKNYFSEWADLYFDMVKNLLNETTKFNQYTSYNKIFFKNNVISEEIQYMNK
jgi:glycogenin glucosyltransferase